MNKSCWREVTATRRARPGVGSVAVLALFAWSTSVSAGPPNWLKSLAKSVRAGQNSLEDFLPDAFEFDPEREDKLCGYYLFLFGEFERLKRSELDHKRKGLDAHHLWLNALYLRDSTMVKEVEAFAVRVSDKIAVAGVTAGLIWLGKIVIDNWPFGFRYSDVGDDERVEELDAK